MTKKKMFQANVNKFCYLQLGLQYLYIVAQFKRKHVKKSYFIQCTFNRTEVLLQIKNVCANPARLYDYYGL